MQQCHRAKGEEKNINLASIFYVHNYTYLDLKDQRRRKLLYNKVKIKT